MILFSIGGWDWLLPLCILPAGSTLVSWCLMLCNWFPGENGGGENGADLTDADLRGCDFSLANAQKANLTNAILEGALVTGNTSFKNAVITGADFTEVGWRDDQRKELCKVANGTNPVTGNATRETLLCDY